MGIFVNFQKIFGTLFLMRCKNFLKVDKNTGEKNLEMAVS